ncbi:acyl-CoA/acyl-ACP dehydrogenase [Sulfitobacter sp. F26169L]|uniref:acyl-CoA dehydrogenase family protein n=1 Tax=Sulfitobacter sp. F26169L TaxID=2996015 RepID=UPI002260E87F|nr:acyl-CoA dehydrogenase family protein [Sulfitobacter sp. F26169L]MCX7567979.1 acyl-CoA/acyl-ACP dehydrogenase [Sulfitobacter sp. F26169L]
MSEFKDILIDQTTRVLKDYCNHEVIEAADNTWPDALWDALAKIELPLALVDPDAGGAGADLDDVGALIRLSGNFAAPVPIGDTMVANWLWSVAGGAPVAGPVVIVPDSGSICTHDSAGRSTTLDGTLCGVPWGQNASILTVAGNTLILIPAGGDAACEQQHNIAGDPRPDLTFFNVTLDADHTRPLPEGWDSSTLEEYGALIRSAQMVGAMDRALALAVEHANMRNQFGRPLAKFQAIQQQLAVAVEQVASAAAALDGALAATSNSADFGFAVAVAKVITGRAATSVAAIAHQVHGAIGFSREYDLQHVTRRLWAWREEYGAELLWQRRIGKRVLAGKGRIWDFITASGEDQKI